MAMASSLAGRGPALRGQPIALAGAPPAKIAERRGMLVAQRQRDLGRVFDVVVRESPERHMRLFLDPPDGTKPPADALQGRPPGGSSHRSKTPPSSSPHSRWCAAVIDGEVLARAKELDTRATQAEQRVTRASRRKGD
jgi:hypothetical protein